jgi:ABC-type antimicrobial peptide transport system permease subunit
VLRASQILVGALTFVVAINLAIRQVAVGVFLGSVLSGGAFVAIGLGLAWAAPLLVAVALTMALVGLLAALGPARRALRIQAIEALRAEG